MDTDHMFHALRQAERGLGRTSPNPMVGAVVVKDGRVVGEGFHPKAGEPHAEIFALRQAGEEARGAALYVTLEPCCHYGRTPPCTDAILAAGVTEVHIAMIDPNPRVSGKGQAQLEAAGIHVVVGEHEADVRELNEIFIHWITARKPLVIASCDAGLDGELSARAAGLRWTTESSTVRHALRLLSHVDAILVDGGAALAEAPQRTMRSHDDNRAGALCPLRVILAGQGRTPLSPQVLDSMVPGRALVVTTGVTSRDRMRAALDHAVEVLVLPGEDGAVDLSALMGELGRREITSMLVEDSSAVLGALLGDGLVDKVLTGVVARSRSAGGAPIMVGAPSRFEAVSRGY